MTVSFTYNSTKIIANAIKLAVQEISEVWLQAFKLIDGDVVKLVVNDSTDFKEIFPDDRKGLYGYFRDIGKTEPEPSETDACFNEYWMNQEVRFVLYSSGYNGNGNSLISKIMPMFSGYEVTAIYFDKQEIFKDEIENSKLSLSPNTFIWAIDFKIRELKKLTDCLLNIDCTVEDLKVC